MFGCFCEGPGSFTWPPTPKDATCSDLNVRNDTDTDRQWLAGVVVTKAVSHIHVGFGQQGMGLHASIVVGCANHCKLEPGHPPPAPFILATP